MAIPFDEKELKVVGEVPSFFGPPTPVYDFPMNQADAMVSLYRDHKPVWVPMGVESNMLCPSINADNVARAFVFEQNPYDNFSDLGLRKDIFGIDWVYVPTAGGSMVQPGNPTLEDANDWKDVIKFPNLDDWDWEGSREANKEMLNNGKANSVMLLNGCWFERMISWFDFEGAAMALLDDEQADAIKEMLHATTDLYLKMIDKMVEYYAPLHGVCIHDDWGSQAAPFFSDSVAREFFLPEMKRFVDYCHEKGLWCELHSCGHIEDRIQVFIDAGFDAWSPMSMNDTPALADKYGDKICIGVTSPYTFAPDAPEEEQREAARKFVERFCKPGKMVAINFFGSGVITPAFREELYKQSRIAYAQE